MLNVAVVPVINPEFDQICLDSLADPGSSWGIPVDQTLVVDNTRHGLPRSAWKGPMWRHPDGHNVGVARGWNVGIDFLRGTNADTLTVVSASMFFGPALHCTWDWQIGDHPDLAVLECDGHSWHLITFHRRVFDLVGTFDGNFYPAYFEGIDFGHRMMHAGIPGKWHDAWGTAWCNTLSRRVAGHLDMVDAPADPLLAYYRAKWGGNKGEETFVTPFGDPHLGLDYWEDVPIPQLAARYNLTNWW